MVFAACVASLSCLAGCGGGSREAQAGSGDTAVAVADLPAVPDTATVVDTVPCVDSVVVAPLLTAKELENLQNLISDRLQQLDKNNPLCRNVWGCGVLIDGVQVSMAINTPYWQGEFRKYISDSPYIKFDGPSRPKAIAEIVDSVSELPGVRLRPDSVSFPVGSEYAMFTLENGSDRNLDFGVDYIVGYLGADGVWYRLPNPGFWYSLGIYLKPTGRYGIKASLHPALNRNRPGTYRLYKKVSFEGEKDFKWLMTEFILD